MSASTAQNEERKEDEENDHMEGDARQARIPNQTQNDLNTIKKGIFKRKYINQDDIKNVIKLLGYKYIDDVIIELPEDYFTKYYPKKERVSTVISEKPYLLSSVAEFLDEINPFKLS